jgi:hypothetical protein
MPTCIYCKTDVSEQWVERHKSMCPQGPTSRTCPYCTIPISKRRYNLHLGRCPQKPGKQHTASQPRNGLQLKASSKPA